ncbi:MAG: nickel-dependent hydrogenase large subunit [Acidobacteriota bacterium]|nr:MAG: nickel-dependent hydrogenase large subunit [Acidobacteriota bacterium]
MVFKHLPIQFDNYGRAFLRDEDAEAPFDFRDEVRLQRETRRERAIETVAGRSALMEFSSDPVTRTVAAMAVTASIDLEHRRVMDARLEATHFSGFELILNEHEPSDAVPLTSRISGRASVSHMIAASMALEMAGGVTPPPMAVITRNLGSCGEMLSECIRHLFLLAGPDYSEQVIRRTNPSLWRRAEQTAARGRAIHGLGTVADLMRGLNQLTGHLYLEALQHTRLAVEVVTLTLGKYPHPSAILPGGVGTEANRDTFNQVLGRINSLLDYSKKVTAVWDDLIEFFYAAEPLTRRSGELAGNLLTLGIWDDPESYDAAYHNCNVWGDRRLSRPAAIIEGTVRTDRLSDINIGIEEFIEHAYFSHWNHQRFLSDPLSGPLSPYHPWNKETIPFPDKADWRGKYTWVTAPRWDRETMETGPIARLWSNATGDEASFQFIGSVNRGLEFEIPKGQRPAIRLVWKIPERPNTLERIRARAYQLSYTGLAAFASLLEAFDCLRRGETEMSKRFNLPDRSVGVGFWESSSGPMSHHIVIRNRRLANYQMITPLEWMGSPRDASGTPGTLEAAVINTPLIEEFQDPADFTGIDLLRTIRSFDP